MEEKMAQNERLIRLLEAFKEESDGYQDLKTPDDPEQQRVLLRSLMNIRPPKELPDEILDLQDAYLQERAREKMIIFKYQLGYILAGKRRLAKSLDVMKPELERYTRIAGQIKEKSKERNTLLSEKKATPVINIPKHRNLSRRIAELTEELEELRTEKKRLLASLDYAEDTGLSTVKKDISAMEANLERLEQQEQKYTAELNAALTEYNELKAQEADFDPDELAMGQLEIRPQKEASAESKIQTAYGDKYDFWTMVGAKREVAELLGEEEPRSVRERLRRKEIEKQRVSLERKPQRKKSKDHGWER